MKTIFATLVILTIVVLSQAQEIKDCYILTITNDTILSTDWVNLEKSETLLLSFRMVKHNSEYSMELKYNFGKGDVFSVAKGDSVMIKFDSGYSFSIYANDNVISKIGGASYPGSMKGAITQGVCVIYPLTLGHILGLIDNPQFKH